MRVYFLFFIFIVLGGAFVGTALFFFEKANQSRTAYIYIPKIEQRAVILPPVPLAPEIEFSSEELQPGDTLLLRINNSKATSASAFWGKEEIKFFPFGNSLLAFAGIDTRAKTDASTLKIILPSGKTFRKELAVKERIFPKTKLTVPPALVRQGVSGKTLVQNITKSDQTTLENVFEIMTPEIYFDAPFKTPLPQWVDVGRFGAVRESNEGAIRHLGVDLAAKPGDPVGAANNGVVRFVADLPNFGISIALDHGQGIFSAYLHLSEAKVVKGQRVNKGDIVGLVGSTGEYSFEPHLHFSVKIRGTSVDPRRFIDVTKSFLGGL